MDHSQVFDNINQSLLLAILEDYGFCTSSLKLMQAYLCNRYQKTEVMGHLVAELITEIFLLLINSNLCNYADDSTQYAINKNLHVVKYIERQS